MTDVQPDTLRILAIHRYFWPDTAPYGVILRLIARQWAADGHKVTVLSTQPSYRTGQDLPHRPGLETEHNVQVRRVTLPSEKDRGRLIRVINVMFWSMTIFFYIVRHRRFDVVMISTTPPVVAAAAARYACRLTGAKLVYHCMDIHPEIGRLTGEFQNSAVYNTLRSVDAATCRKAARVVVLSDDMQTAVADRPGTEKTNISVINNFDTAEQQESSSGQNLLPPKIADKLRIIFAGNIGRFQGLDYVADALLKLDNDLPCEIYFVGGGVMLESLKTLLHEQLGHSVFFISHQPANAIRNMLAQSDICLVSLSPDVARFAYPCKTMTYLAEGRPLFACVEQQSSLAQLIIDNNLGVVTPPNDSETLAKAITELALDPERIAMYKQQAEELGPGLFARDKILKSWSTMVGEL